MPEKHQDISINLGSQGKESVTNVFYKWATQAGKAIIIGIELIALGALGYRFVIDRQIVDLHDEIRAQEVFVERQQAAEGEYRNIQDRLTNIKLVTEESRSKVEIMNNISKLIQNGTFNSTTLVINLNTITLSGKTFSILVLDNFIQFVKKNEAVKSISVDEISTINEEIRFKIRIDLEDLLETEQ